MRTLVFKNVVVAARQLNPSIITDLWLVNNEVFTAQELDTASDRVQLPMLSQFKFAGFDFMVLPDRLQLTVRDDNIDAGQMFTDKVATVVEALPHTPYIAIGANFNYRIEPNQGTLLDFCSQFRPSAGHLPGAVQGDDTHYGTNVRKSVLNTRLTLKATPVPHPQNSTLNPFLETDLNYHRTLTSGNEVNEILDVLNAWPQFNDETNTILNTIDQ